MSMQVPAAVPPVLPTGPAPAVSAEAPRGSGMARGAAVAATLAAVAALVAWGDRLPAPRPSGVPAREFSEARALPILRHLASDIGDRGIGTAGQDSAVAYLSGLLRAIPGVEVAVQDEVVAAPYLYAPGVTGVYRVRNVLARIRGREPGAVLFSSHFDTPPESVGAGDAAMVVAAMVEAVRALAADPSPPRHTLVFILGDGEEDGLLGSSAFLRHPWARDLRAFVNLESAGPGGGLLLFQAGPGNAWLARAYARGVGRPYGTVLAQDLFQGGVVPSQTDFRAYRDLGGLRGLDLATVRDGYAYHTRLDRVGRVPPGAVQQVGEAVVGLGRGFGAGGLPGDVGGPPAVFYSLPGRGMLVYGVGTAWILAAAALLLAVAALGVAVRRRALTLRAAAAGLAATLLACVAGLALPLLAAWVTGSLLGRPHGWYAHPRLGVAAFGSLALAGAAAVHALWGRVEARGRADPSGPRLGRWAGGVVFWAAALLGLTLAGLGSAYLALWWLAPAAAALLLSVLRPRRSTLWCVLALVPGAVVTAGAGFLLVEFFVPLAGRMASPSPLDPLIAALVAAPVVLAAALALPAALPLRRAGTAAAALGALGVVATVALALSSPYSAERPKRLTLSQLDEADGTARLTVAGGDALDAGPLLRGLPYPMEASGPGRRVYQGAVPPGAPPQPAAEVSSSPLDATRGTRTVRLRVAGGEYRRLVLTVPSARLAGWSITPTLPALPPGDDTYRVRVIPGRGRAWEATLQVRGAAPVDARLTTVYEPAPGGAVRMAESRLPPWVVAATRLDRSSIVRL